MFCAVEKWAKNAILKPSIDDEMRDDIIDNMLHRFRSFKYFCNGDYVVIHDAKYYCLFKINLTKNHLTMLPIASHPRSSGHVAAFSS